MGILEEYNRFKDAPWFPDDIEIGSRSTNEFHDHHLLLILRGAALTGLSKRGIVVAWIGKNKCLVNGTKCATIDEAIIKTLDKNGYSIHN